MFRILLFIFAVTVTGALLLSPSAHATVSIHAGTYQVPALIVTRDGKAEAVFNLKTRSEFRLALTGEKAKTLLGKTLQSALLTFRIKTTSDRYRQSAELLAVDELAGKSVPVRVGTDFQAVP